MGAIGIVLLIVVAVPVVLFVRHAVRYWGAGAPRHGGAEIDSGIGAYITQLRTGHHREHVSDGGNDSSLIYDIPSDSGSVGDGGGSSD